MNIANYDKGAVKSLFVYFRKNGMNDNGICGLLGNLYAESKLFSTNLQNSYNTKFGMTDEEYTKAVDNGSYMSFPTDYAGYGLAQWTSSGRKAGLLNFAHSRKKSIGDLDTQIEWLHKELTTSYKAVWNELCSPNNSVSSCARIVMTKFERPKDQSENAQQKRVQYAEDFFQQYCMKKTYLLTAYEFVQILTKLLFDNTVYVYGGFGAPLNAKNKARYAGKYVDKNCNENTFGFDCVGMIKGILWGFNFDKSKTYGGASYASNGVPDVGARAMMNTYCTDVTTDFNNIEVGEAVWLSGNPDSHIGVYVGDGRVIECSPKWENGVQLSFVKNLGKNTGHCRIWEKHGKLPWIDYGVAPEIPIVEEKKEESKDEFYTVAKGDSLCAIASKLKKKGYNITWQKIAELNNIKPPYTIYPGQTLRLR